MLQLYRCSTKPKGDIPYVILIINVRTTVSLTGLFNEVHTDENQHGQMCLRFSMRVRVCVCVVTLVFLILIHTIPFRPLSRYVGDFIVTIFCLFRFGFERELVAVSRINIYLINWHLFHMEIITCISLFVSARQEINIDQTPLL